MIAAKLVGCACVAAFAALWCASYASGMRRRIDALGRAKRFAEFVAEQIGYYETPYPEIVAKFAAAEGVAVKQEQGAPPLFAEDVAVDGGAPDSSRLTYLAAVGRRLAAGLDGEDGTRFLAFYDGVGAGFTDTELRLCDEARRYFEDRLAAACREYSQKTRVRTALALFAAFSVCVLVW